MYSSGDITLKKLHQKRGKKAIEDINIIPRYGGTIIHDCWASYLSYMHCGHGLCGSHLLRELTFIIDSNGYLWAIKIKKLLQEACKKVAKFCLLHGRGGHMMKECDTLKRQVKGLQSDKKKIGLAWPMAMGAHSPTVSRSSMPLLARASRMP